jgi:hypothetical protein
MKYLLEFHGNPPIWNGIFVAAKMQHSLTSLLLTGIHAFTFASLPWLTTPAGVWDTRVEAVQVRGLNRNESEKLKRRVSGEEM